MYSITWKSRSLFIFLRHQLENPFLKTNLSCIFASTMTTLYIPSDYNSALQGIHKKVKGGIKDDEDEIHILGFSINGAITFSLATFVIANLFRN